MFACSCRNYKLFCFKVLNCYGHKKWKNSTLLDSTFSFSTVSKWAAEFKRGGSSIQDDENSRLPKDAANNETMTNIRNAILRERQLKILGLRLNVQNGSRRK